MTRTSSTITQVIARSAWPLAADKNKLEAEVGPFLTKEEDCAKQVAEISEAELTLKL